MFSSLGDRFIVIFSGGNLKSFKSRADFTLSFDSFILVLTIPTIVKLGIPFVNVASTSIIVASILSSVADFIIFIRTLYLFLNSTIN